MKVECNICKIRWKLSATKTTSGKTEYLQPSMVHLVVEEKGWGGDGERDKNKTTLEEERRKGATAISAFLTKHKQRSGNISDKQDTHTNAKASDNVKENGNVIHELDLDLSNSVGTFYKDEGIEGRGGKEHLVINLIARARDQNTLVTYFYIGVAWRGWYQITTKLELQNL
jgi:hypothetical protein